MKNEVAVREIKSFGFEGTEVRVEMRNGKPWFVAKDVCDVLGIKAPEAAYSRLVRDGIGLADVTDSSGRAQQMTIINEANLYRLIMRSDKENAIRFQNWVVEDVLPSIRKTGGYSVLGVPQTFREALLLAAEQQRLIEEAAPKVLAYDLLSAAPNSICFRDTAKMLKIRPQTFTRFLRENGYIFGEHNTAYQHAIDSGWLTVRMIAKDTEKGPLQFTQTLVTGKGVAYFAKKTVALHDAEMEDEQVEITE